MEKDIFEILNGNGDLEKLFDNKETPNALYRYRSFDQYWKSNLFDGQVYLAPASSFNDLYDCCPVINYDIQIQKLYEYATNKIREISKSKNQSIIDIIREKNDDYLNNLIKMSVYLSPEDILTKIELIWPDVRKNSNNLKDYIKEEGDKLANNVRDESRVVCFSEINDSQLMWAHYANSHSGFCIKYNLENFDFNNESKYLCTGFAPVLYLKNRYGISPNTNLQLYNYLWLLELMKSDVWSYEKEWRIISNTAKISTATIDLSKAIDAVFLGANSLKNHTDCVEEIVKWAKQSKKTIFIAKNSNSDFSISFEELIL